MGKLKRFFGCACCDPERGDVYEVSRAADIENTSLQNVIYPLEEKQCLSVCQPPALCEGHVDSIVEQHEFNPPFSSTKVDNCKHNHASRNSSCATCPDSSGFCTEDVPTYPSDNHFTTMELSEEGAKATEEVKTVSISQPPTICEDHTTSTVVDTISNVEDTISSVGDSVSTVKDITDIVKQDTFTIEQQELNSSFTNVDSDKDNLVSKDSNLTCPNSSGFCSESVTVIDPSDIHYVTTIELPEEGTKEVTILGRCSVLYSPCSSNE